MRLFIIEMRKKARLTNTEVEEDVITFMKWATTSLLSPRAVWLFSMAVSHGSVFILLRAAMRNNNINVAKGCLYLLKSLAWAENLSLYRQCIMRNGFTEEVQVMFILRQFLQIRRVQKSLNFQLCGGWWTSKNVDSKMGGIF